jgi:hypothetical protein
MTPTFGDVSVVSMIEHWCGKQGRWWPGHGTCGRDFCGPYMPLSTKLHQTGEDTDICFRSDYWHLRDRSTSTSQRSAMETFFAEWRRRRSMLYNPTQRLRRPRTSLPGRSPKSDLKSRINNIRIQDYLAAYCTCT